MSILRNLFIVLLAAILPAAVSCFSSSVSHSSKLLLHKLPHHTNTIPTTTTQLHSSSSPFNLLPNTLNTLFSTTNKSQKELTSLKQQLYTTCQSTYGKCTPTSRSQIESLIAQLTPLNPTPSPSTSSKLQREWVLLWTSEKEINFFLEKGISTEITQTLENGTTLQNCIPFVNGGSFAVSGKITPEDDNELRTQFEFQEATLDIGKWGKYNFPPVGKGWFDTVYLDEELRIDLNSRNDILICRGGD